MFEESACQKSDCLLNNILYNSLTKIEMLATQKLAIFSRNAIKIVLESHIITQ